MKRKMKRIFSLMLALTMALGVLPMMPIKALATETITTCTLTGVTKPVAGEYPTIDGISLGDQVVIDERYTSWLCWDGTEYFGDVDVSLPFEEGKKYALFIWADAASGYRFASDVKVIYNGKELPDCDPAFPYNATDKEVVVGNRSVTILVLADDMPIPQYDITVTDGTAAVGTQAAATAEEGAEVTITANAPAEGMVFDKWEVVSGGVTFADATSATTTFVMPRGAVSVKATYKAVYDITVTDGKATVDTQEAATAEEGTVVTITANAPAAGKVFDKWEVMSGNVTIADVTNATTTFTMPRGAVSVKATYKAAEYNITVTEGKATSGTETVTKAQKDVIITLTANSPAEGKVFDKWEVVSGSVIIANANASITTFVMPESAVSIKAVYKDANGWITTENNQEVYYQNGTIAKSQWCQDGEKWYYVNETGARVTDWQKIGDTWYYFYSDGTMADSTWVGDCYVGASGAWVENPLPEGWMQSGSKWWYQYPDGTYAQSTWKKIGGAWYYFDKDGWMSTGWTFDGSDWYYMNADGTMKTGWLSDGGTWYYLRPSGAMATGWVNDGGDWYFMDNSGAMKTGWVDINGTWYYLYESGVMAHDIVIDGYVLDASGACN